MAIADGKRIVIEFDLPLVGDPSGNADKFTVTVPTLPYGYGGSTAEETCTVTAVEPYTGINTALDLSAGTLTDTVCAGGILSLREVNEDK